MFEINPLHASYNRRTFLSCYETVEAKEREKALCLGNTISVEPIIQVLENT